MKNNENNLPEVEPWRSQDIECECPHCGEVILVGEYPYNGGEEECDKCGEKFYCKQWDGD